MFVYDFKCDNLTKIDYKHYLQQPHRYPVAPGFFVINFDGLSRSHRCNPLDVSTILDIRDAGRIIPDNYAGPEPGMDS